MITAEEFERAQAIIGLRGRAGPVRHENPFAGLIRCGHCGCSIVAEFHNKGGKTYTYHRCGRVKPRVVCKEKPIAQVELLAQLTDYCRYLVIPEPILAFLRRKLDAVDTADAGMALRVREQRDRALASLEREERELLGMRMRQLVSDEEFQNEREALRERRKDLEVRRETTTAVSEEVETRKAEVLGLVDLAHGLPHVLEHGDPVQVRAILQQLHLKITLRSRRLDFTAPKPLSMLIEAGVTSGWCSRWFDIWKWIQFGEPATELGISDAELRLMMGEDSKSVERLARARDRASRGQLPATGVASEASAPSAPYSLAGH
jgi:hypothetical protein